MTNDNLEDCIECDLGNSCNSCKTFHGVIKGDPSSQHHYLKLLIHTFHEEHTELNQLLSKENTKLKKEAEENACLATANKKLKKDAEENTCLATANKKLKKKVEEMNTYVGALLLFVISGIVYKFIF